MTLSYIPSSLSLSEIEFRVQNAIAIALDIDTEEIEPDSSIVDLGADSLDFLDMEIQLERCFGITMPRRDMLLERLFGRFGRNTMIDHGVVSEKGAEILHVLMPEVPVIKLKNRTYYELMELVTQATLVRIVGKMIKVKENLPKICPKCSAQMTLSKVSPETSCSACGTIIAAPSAVDVLMTDIMEKAKALGL